MTKICALSDLHGHLPKIEPCELVLLAGDIVPLNIQFDNAAATLWFLDTFTKWINSLPCEDVIMVAGNHDKLLEQASFIAHALERATHFKLAYLSGTTYEYETYKCYKIYGSPFCHKFGNWSFMQSEEWLKGYYDNIPEDTDIILTHDTPMLGDLDLLPPSQWNPKAVHAGGKALADAICRVKPRYVFCGHLHTCKDKYLKLDNTEIYNVSILDNNYKEIYKPLYLDI
jgi:Icc-related predicted phosphoesterase